MAGKTRVYLEVGRTWTFASAVDWPGWARKGKGVDAALETLQDYEARYRAIAGPSFRPGSLDVIGRLEGGGSTDFGVLGAIGDWDRKPLGKPEVKRLIALLGRAWEYFDRTVAGAPAVLRKGPRGGGRDRDAIVEHVQEAERSAYAPRIGIRVAPRTAWDEQRRAIVDALATPKDDNKWPARYALRRITWHVLDHAWEIEDRSRPA